MLAVCLISRIVQELALRWDSLASVFHDVWACGNGFYLFVGEPLIIIAAATITHAGFPLRMRTTWSLPGFLLASYALCWAQAAIYGYVLRIDDGMDARFAFFPTLLWAGQFFVIRRAMVCRWDQAWQYSVSMLMMKIVIVIISIIIAP